MNDARKKLRLPNTIKQLRQIGEISKQWPLAEHSPNSLIIAQTQPYHFLKKCLGECDKLASIKSQHFGRFGHFSKFGSVYKDGWFIYKNTYFVNIK